MKRRSLSLVLLLRTAVAFGGELSFQELRAIVDLLSRVHLGIRALAAA